MRNADTIAIIGGGPSGAMLAALLARAGKRVAIFDSGKRPGLVIGESLVPAIVPFLRALGIEDEVRSYSTYKPGATWVFGPGDVMTFFFGDVRRARTRYSYNTPRDRFDESVLRAALRAGATLFRHRAVLERGANDRVRLADSTLAATEGFLRAQPDLIVDASGRARLIAKLLDIPTTTGRRRDTALFAHLAGVPVLTDGNVHVDRLSRGWAWRIPLPGRVSVGTVADSTYMHGFGDTAEQQFDALLASDPALKAWGPDVRRLTPVMKYSNYQLTSDRCVGNGWALVGDAFGFVDPIFSSGLLIALDGATVLADAIVSGARNALVRYERHVANHIASWQRIVNYFYDGRLFTLMKVGEETKHTSYGRLLQSHFETHFPRVFTGEGTTNRYSLGLLGFMCKYGIFDKDPIHMSVA